MGILTVYNLRVKSQKIWKFLTWSKMVISIENGPTAMLKFAFGGISWAFLGENDFRMKFQKFEKCNFRSKMIRNDFWPFISILIRNLRHFPALLWTIFAHKWSLFGFIIWFLAEIIIFMKKSYFEVALQISTVWMRQRQTVWSCISRFKIKGTIRIPGWHTEKLLSN